MCDYSKEQLTFELLKFYEEWKNRYLRVVKDSSPTKEYLFYTLDQPMTNNAVTCSEAMGYGMVIFPIMYKFDKSAKEHFTNIYNFIKSYPSVYNKNLMAWQQIMDSNGNIVNREPETSSATDGDMDISYGLLIADKLWSKIDKIDYKYQAIKRIQGLMDSCVDKDDYSLTLGDWVTGLANSTFKGVTRSSDFMLYSLRTFTKTDTKNSKKWNLVIARIQKIISNQMKRESKDNGLMPDFFVKEKGVFIAPNKKILESIHDGDYYFNSARIPWRYSMDSILNKKISISKQLSTLNKWIIKTTSTNPKNIVSGYYLRNGPPGQPFGSSNDLSFVAPFLVLSLLQKDNPNWTINLWNHILSVPIESSTFFGNTLKLMAMIVATGNWISP
ncbi:hypothetical protein QYB59_003049 [Clostridium perfringens]|nr:hypothetical protein [Clostridium perfringens]